MEALAGEVACLRRAFPGSVTWGIAAREWLRLSPRRGFGFHPRLHLAFRALAWAAQRCFDVQHLFGGLGDWFHLRAVKNRPVVLTVAVDGPACEAALLGKVDRFVVEWPGAEQELAAKGISAERIRTILPPVDLARFCPASPPAGPFTVLFASSPDEASWLEARGVDLLLDAAARLPQYRFVLLWRPWGNSLPRVREWIARRRLTNVELKVQRVGDMSREYSQAHAAIAPFVDPHCCKPVPNSIVESLACGRPVVVTPAVRLAGLIAGGRAGICSMASAESLAEGLQRIEGSWPAYAEAARELALGRFSHEAFIGSYRELYRELL